MRGIAAFLVLCCATAGTPLAFPRDDGAHPAQRTEFWRWDADVRAQDGRRYDVIATFARFTIGPVQRADLRSANPWIDGDIVPATFALLDESKLHYVSAARLARRALGAAAAATGRLDVRADGWELRGEPSAAATGMHVRLDVHAPSGGANLFGRVRLPRVFYAHEYAFPVIDVAGTVDAGGERIAVRGLAWIDHSYGTGLVAPDVGGWDRFTIRLDDGRELVLERTRRRDERAKRTTIAVVVERDGRARVLPPGSFVFGVDGPMRWRSARSNAAYPAIFIFSDADLGLPSVSFEPVVSDQEIVAGNRGTTVWNGAVDVFDDAPGSPTAGKRLGGGVAELTGYVDPIAL